MPEVRRLLGETLARARRCGLLKKRVALAAIDASGFEARHVSSYFVRRLAKGGKTSGKWHQTKYRRFPKLAVICDCQSHFILGAVCERRPCPDFNHWIAAMVAAQEFSTIETLVADAGYDAEWIHQRRGWCLARALLFRPSMAARRRSRQGVTIAA